MKPQARWQRGFIRPAVIIVLVVAITTSLGGVIYAYMSRKSPKQEVLPLSAAGNVCSSLPKFAMPVEAVSIRSVSYPGQERPLGSGKYATYATFIVRSDTNEAFIKLPADSKLRAGAIYKDNNDTQYTLEFQTKCGFIIRFDHLLQLSLEMQDEISSLKISDSKPTSLSKLSGKEFLAGTILASRVGYGSTSQGFFDYGLYQPDERNSASSRKEWLTDPMHASEDAQHGLCWLDFLLPDELSNVKIIPPTDPDTSKKSDYCDAAY